MRNSITTEGAPLDAPSFFIYISHSFSLEFQHHRLAWAKLYILIDKNGATICHIRSLVV